MQIAQISKADSAGGGASRVAEDLTILMNKSGHCATHYVSYSSKGYNQQRQPLYGSNPFINRNTRRAHHLLRRVGLSELVPLELPALLAGNIKSFDILHFHDLSSAMSPLTLAWLSRTMPVVWTVHDCSPFTGGCLYPMDCEGYKSRCGSCPQIGSWPLDSVVDGTRLSRALKRRIHRTGRVQCVTPSKWMAQMAMASGLLSTEPMVITNGVDTETYKPAANFSELRRRLGLRDDVPILLVSAGHIRDPRKGIQLALEAVRAIDREFRPVVLAMGAMHRDDEGLFQGLRWFSTGYISDPAQAAQYYACADFFLFCSLADNQPLAVLESMSCGTPVIGFACGGIPELVIDNVCGKLVPPEDMTSLIEVMRFVLRERIATDLGRAARKRIESYHSQEVHLAAHLELYDAILSRQEIAHVSY
ncbi:glycosyltransferase [Thiocystis violascens]|uniref:Glycosyltransferase n=1 Tax=Thiocystis violascens (strain ATCC 17096 / DSM 198 / 6111) TaxID=765911 RepID=I3Y5D6_THIV6|nr:glycosyltransferase [Thiocystis violascens]AFL72204.1 glycosyltransferase [Thiocystis violascens DSM 198]